MKKPKTCHGWPTSGGCAKPVQTKKSHRDGGWSPFFCISCDEARIAHIDRQFERISRIFNQPAPAQPASGAETEGTT